MAPAGAALLAALLLAGCASTKSTDVQHEPGAGTPPTSAAPHPQAPVPISAADTLSSEEARDLAAIEAERYQGPVGSSNEDLDDELQDFLEEESNVLLTEKVGYDIPIVINERVEYFIDYFQFRVRKSFAKWLTRAPQYVPYLKDRFREEGLPQDLIYISLIESGFSPQATSHANAVGYWQFIAGTGRRYGLRIDRWVDERRDLEKSTSAAISYLKDLHRMFGSWYLAAAAYNSGEAKIQRAIDRYGSENLWELSEFSYLRDETKNYVPKLIAAILIAKEPEKYGFTGIREVPPADVEYVTVPARTDLRAIAASAGTSVETIRALNPHLRSRSTPPGVTSFEVRVPRGGAPQFQERLASIPAAQRVAPEYRTHVVRRGENPLAIARKYGITTSALMEDNHIRNARRLRVGQRLRIPIPERELEDLPPLEIAAAPGRRLEDPVQPSAPAARSVEHADIAARTPARANGGVQAPSAAPAHRGFEAPPAASNGGFEARAAAPANRGFEARPPPTANDEVRPPGVSPVALPATPVAAPPVSPRQAPGERVASTTRYRVKKGDTLYRIAGRHGVTVAEMETWNPRARSRIRPGMVLTIHPSAKDGEEGAPDALAAAPPPSSARASARPQTGAAGNAGPDSRATPVDKRGADRVGGRTMHTVRRGDTLYSLARRHNVTVAQLRQWNDIPGSRIRVGERLVFFTDPETPATP